jgi:hypothetical protein
LGVLKLKRGINMMFSEDSFLEDSGFKEKPGYKAGKRLQRGVLRSLGLWQRQRYDIRFVSHQGQLQYKKVIFNTISQAARIGSALETYGQSPHFPALIGRQHNAVWVTFVPGTPVDVFDEAVLEQLIEFYAAIYSRASRLISIENASVWRQFEDNLTFLWNQKAFGRGFMEELHATAEVWAPEKVWIGFDYTDPIENNLVRREEQQTICAIDIKNIRADVLLGRGLAKARRCWLAEPYPFLEALARAGAPELAPCFPFVELVDRVQRISAKLSKRMPERKRRRYLQRETAALSELLISSRR